MNQAAIVMYTRATCPYCVAARQLLKTKQLDWSEISIDAEPHRREEMIERSGRRTVPQIFVGDHHVGGFDDLDEMNEAGEFDRLLDA